MTAEIFSIRSEDPNSSDAQTLLDELTAMNSIFGPVGSERPFASFTLPGRSVLLLVRDSTGVPFGCGAFTPKSHFNATLTGPYCRSDRVEVNEAVLRRLERSGAQFGFLALNIDVSEKNYRALAFFRACGFLPTTTSIYRPKTAGACSLQKPLSQKAGHFRSVESRASLSKRL